MHPAGTGTESAAGFLFGAGGAHVDYRLTSQVHGTPALDGGLLAVVDGAGRARLLSFEEALSDQKSQWAMRANTELEAYQSVPGESLAGDGFGAAEPRAVILELTVRSSMDAERWGSWCAMQRRRRFSRQRRRWKRR